jgi:predicted lipoprotein with Yx(FWY)xxD motif
LPRRPRIRRRRLWRQQQLVQLEHDRQAAVLGDEDHVVGATVDVRKSDLGTMLTDSSGRTLYLFEKDKGDASTCNGSCASAWPPLTTTGAPKAGTGVKASALGTTKRQDGTSEVTYKATRCTTTSATAARA